MKKMKCPLHCMDSEGDRRLENVDQDLIQLRKEFKLGIERTKHVFIWFLVELEIKVEILELKVVKMEVQVHPRASA